MLVIGLTQGMQPIIGYNHGAMKPGRVLLTLKYGVLAGTSFTTLGFLACVFFPRGIAGLFTDDASLISLAANGLIICVLAFPLIGSQIIIGNFFQAIGKARLAIFLSLTRQMLFLLPFLLVLPRFWGQDGVWASLPLADMLSFIVTLLFIRRFLKYYRLKTGTTWFPARERHNLSPHLSYLHEPAFPARSFRGAAGGEWNRFFPSFGEKPFPPTVLPLAFCRT